MAIITLTTDFGTGDHEVGVLKGVIWKIAPAVQIADISHAITPHHVLEAALILWRVASYFPAGTIHLAVVDPGVGTPRRGIAARLSTQYFVGPDNGLISLLLNRAEELRHTVQIVQLDQSNYWLQDVASVFHGRDIFAPVAAHVASGVGLDAFGASISDPVRLEIPKPTPTSNGWLGQVIHVDHFGNLTTNLQLDHIKSAKEVMIRIKGMEISGLVTTFGDRPTGTLIALLDSSGLLAISLVNGNAAQYLDVVESDPVDVVIKA